MLLIAFSGYVVIVTSNTKNMTIRQKILKAVYPAFTWFGKLTGRNAKVFTNENSSMPVQSIYDLSVTFNNGDTISLSKYKGIKMLLVNTASDCGYTNQYAELEELYKENQSKLVVIGFPANDFKEQEKGNDSDIAEFCKINFGVSFPLATKSTVIKGAAQNPVFNWLSDASKNGWNNAAPSWNFSKYLVNEQGVLTNYFEPAVSPLSPEVTDAVSK
jgi:glutathione peroxidase